MWIQYTHTHTHTHTHTFCVFTGCLEWNVFCENFHIFANSCRNYSAYVSCKMCLPYQQTDIRSVNCFILALFARSDVQKTGI
jgi:hypothetical protein